MWLFWIAVLAVAVWAIVRVVPSRGGAVADGDALPHGGRSSETPLEILDRRLASGEIDAEAYEQLRSKLTSHPSTGIG